jgi:negative regulator of flagellin synthesis FlgM
MKGITGNPALDAYQRASVQPVSSTPQAQGASGESVIPTRQATQAAKVSISEEARALASEPPPVNSEKVEALRESIRAGTFQVDSKQIAEELLDDLE